MACVNWPGCGTMSTRNQKEVISQSPLTGWAPTTAKPEIVEYVAACTATTMALLMGAEVLDLTEEVSHSDIHAMLRTPRK